MRRTRILIPLFALCALAVGVAPTATAEPLPSSVPEVGLATPAEEALLEQQLAESMPVIATYNGKKIDLADGWQGAQACSEVPTGEVYCYDSAEEADQALASFAPAAARTPESGAVSAKGSGEFGPTAKGAGALREANSSRLCLMARCVRSCPALCGTRCRHGAGDHVSVYVP